MDREALMTEYDHMANYQGETFSGRLDTLRVLSLSGQGILLQDPHSGMFTVSWDPIAECFRLIAVPAWPDGAEEAITKILDRVYDEEGTDLWLRAARVKGWDHETALQRAQALQDGVAT